MKDVTLPPYYHCHLAMKLPTTIDYLLPVEVRDLRHHTLKRRIRHMDDSLNPAKSASVRLNA